jgi:hypothetical protein
VNDLWFVELDSGLTFSLIFSMKNVKSVENKKRQEYAIAIIVASFEVIKVTSAGSTQAHCRVKNMCLLVT